jgi:hypothetical protein
MFADVTSSYTCNPGAGLTSGAYLLRMSHLKLESFRNSTSRDFIKPESVCQEDRRSCIIDPVVIGGIVVTVVTVTFLAVFIYKNRRRGHGI